MPEKVVATTQGQERYREKPFLRLLDAYVLWAIGELPRRRQAQLVALEGSLRQAYGRPGPWYSVVAEVMQFPHGIDVAIRDIWRSYLADATRAGAAADPLAFTHAFVDENWAPPASSSHP
jgi:hypothetical protein